MATGHYDKPYDPPAEPGKQQWEKKFPTSIIHAHDFKNVTPFIRKNVVIIGNGPSGWDISSQLKDVAKSVTMSLRGFTLPDGRMRIVSDGVTSKVLTISRYYPKARKIEFACGTMAHDVDYIIYCTGYEYDFSFIVKNRAGQELFPKGQKVERLYEHIFYTAEPTLAFIGLPKMTAAFTIAEAQSAYVARVFSNRLDRPTQQEVRTYFKTMSKECEEDNMSCQQYHTLAPSRDRDYINHLVSMALKARPFKHGTRGKPPPYWCHCMDSARHLSRDARAAHKAKGDVRHAFRSFKDLEIPLKAPCTGDHLTAIPAGCVACFIPHE